MAGLTVRLGTWDVVESLRARSLRAPGDLFIGMGVGSNGGRLVARAGRVVVVPTRTANVLAALFCGRLLSRQDLIALLFDDRADGGPDRADQAVSMAIAHARTAGAALGIQVDTVWGRGTRARLVDPRFTS